MFLNMVFLVAKALAKEILKMLKEKADAKTSEAIIKKHATNRLLGSCDYDKELDKTVRSFYPDAISWFISKNARFEMKRGYAFVVFVKVPGLNRARFLNLRCCYSLKRGYFFISSLPPIRKEKDIEEKKDWYKENESEIMELNQKAIDNNDASFLIPNSMLQGTPKNIIEDILSKNAFGPIFIDSGVVCTAREVIEL